MLLLLFRGLAAILGAPPSRTRRTRYAVASDARMVPAVSATARNRYAISARAMTLPSVARDRTTRHTITRTREVAYARER